MRTTPILLGLSFFGATFASSSTKSAPSDRGNLRRQLRDDSANVVTVISPDGLATASVTTKNDWHEEGVHYVHMRVQFDNNDLKERDICGITFSIEGFDPSDPRTQYGNFEVLPNGRGMIPGSSSQSNPLRYSRLGPKTRPAWFIGLLMPFSSSTHDFPTVTIDEVHLCEPLDDTATAPVTKENKEATTP